MVNDIVFNFLNNSMHIIRYGKNMLFKKKAYFGQNMLFYYRNMLLIYQNMVLLLKNTKICTYMPKITKKEHIYHVSAYNTLIPEIQKKSAALVIILSERSLRQPEISTNVF